MFSSNSNNFDLYSSELVCLYVNRYRRLNQLLINLNSKYKLRFTDDILSVDDNEDYVDLFHSKYHTNLKILCGPNGVGKTSIINILRNRAKKADFFVLLRDKDGKFACTKKIELQFNKKSIVLQDTYIVDQFSEICATHAELEVESLSCKKNILFSYINNKEIYDSILGRNLFNGFEINPSDFSDAAENIANEIRNQCNTNIFILELEEFLKEKPIRYMFLESSRDSTFDSFWNIIKVAIKETPENDIFQILDTEINKILNSKYEELNTKIVDMIGMSPSTYELSYQKYSIDQYSVLNDKLCEIIESFENAVKDSFLKRKHHIYIHNDILKDRYTFIPFFEDGGSRIYFGDLSAGEQIFIWNLYSLLPAMSQPNGVWHFEDEPDKSLHPEWKRQFLSIYLDSINKTHKFLIDHALDEDKWKYQNKIYNIVLTTHSPFLLSDVPKDNIVFLDIDSEDNRVIQNNAPNTFAGNIGEMFYSNFFMQETIGDFAKKYIECSLQELNSGISISRKKELEKIFVMVGDEILKRLLLDRLEHAEIR